MKNYADQGGCYWPRWITPSEICIILYILQKPNSLRDLSEISRGEGGGNRGRVTTFRDSEKGAVMKNGPLKGGGSCKYMPVIM